MARLVICFLACLAFAQGRHEKYEGHQLYQISGSAQEINSLETQLDIISARPGRQEIGQLQALVRLSPEVKEQWLQYFDGKQISYSMLIDNLADAFRKEDAQVEAAKASASAPSNGRTIGWETFYRHQEVNDHLDELAEQYPDIVTVINAALTYEGRQIKYVRISTTRFEDLRKPVIVIDAMVHAREWVTTPVALYIINQLVVDIADNRLTEDLDWVIIPLANPDGYEYTHDEDRLWRKTRSLAHEGAENCPGVDGNRNFDHYWGTSPGSANPCSIIYEGPTPFSEVETRVIRDVVNQHINRAALYISLHSYGNMFLYAWGNNGTLPSNGLMLHLAGINMATAIDAVALDKADPYIVGNAANVLYFTTGTSRDWTRAVGVPLTYTLELPGYEYMFEVPSDYVEQIVTETWAGIYAGAHYVRSTYDHTLFTEQQIWAALKLNRILDIYYTSNVTSYEVSMVEINLVVNNTEFRAKAFTDVGHPYFRAHIVFPIQTGATFYRIDIYTCSNLKESDEVVDKVERISAEQDSELSALLPFYVKGKNPIWNRLLGHQKKKAKK